MDAICSISLPGSPGDPGGPMWAVSEIDIKSGGNEFFNIAMEAMAHENP